MSATLDAPSLAERLDGWPCLCAADRLFDLRIDYTPHSAAPLERQVELALRRLLDEGLDGDVLIFLPGAAEIRSAQRQCQPLLDRYGLLGLPLHGDLPAEAQDRAVTPAAQRKVIFSTNLAESSVTIEGVTAVIDSGLARVARDSAATGLPVLEIARVSKASAIQRAGRAGRIRAGRAIRLYPVEDFARRPENEQPEILRRELSGLVLEMKAMGVRRILNLPWLDPPPDAAIERAQRLLKELGATDAAGNLTPLGSRMARLPLHPRLSALVLEAESRGAGEQGCAAAAALSLGERLSEPPPVHGPSDVLAMIEREWSPPLKRLFEKVHRYVRPRTRAQCEDALLVAILRAFPDRVARRRGNELLLAGGGSAVLAPSSVVRDATWLVAVDIEQRPERGLPLVRLASMIRPDWLLELFPDRIETREALEWNRHAERVESVGALLYEGLVLEESRHGAGPHEAVAGLLAQKALEAGIERFLDDPAEINSLLARAAFAARYGGPPPIDDNAAKEALGGLCAGLRSFAELRQACANGGLLRAILSRYSPAERRLLDEFAPERLRLPGGRTVRIHYALQQTPWAASRLQDFFGITETPRIAGGRVPLVLHLLAPNQRPVQTTTDLAGFWQRLYPQLRRELSRRYPKHPWPEDPAGAWPQRR
jgi:ATP-dependent helicase HrpB